MQLSFRPVVTRLHKLHRLISNAVKIRASVKIQSNSCVNKTTKQLEKGDPVDSQTSYILFQESVGKHCGNNFKEYNKQRLLD